MECVALSLPLLCFGDQIVNVVRLVLEGFLVCPGFNSVFIDLIPLPVQACLTIHFGSLEKEFGDTNAVVGVET